MSTHPARGCGPNDQQGNLGARYCVCGSTKICKFQMIVHQKGHNYGYSTHWMSRFDSLTGMKHEVKM